MSRKSEEEFKCLRIRVEGKTLIHIANLARALDLCIVQIKKKHDGWYYGYGNTRNKISTGRLYD